MCDYEVCCYIVSFYDNMGNCVTKEFDIYEEAVKYAKFYSGMQEVNIFQLRRCIYDL